MLKGQANLLGNVEPGYAVLDEKTGHTLYKLGWNGPDGKNVVDVDQMEIVRAANDRPVYVMSQKVSAIVKEEILRTPGFRGMKL